MIVPWMVIVNSLRFCLFASDSKTYMFLSFTNKNSWFLPLNYSLLFKKYLFMHNIVFLTIILVIVCVFVMITDRSFMQLLHWPLGDAFWVRQLSLWNFAPNYKINDYTFPLHYALSSKVALYDINKTNHMFAFCLFYIFVYQ